MSPTRQTLDDPPTSAAARKAIDGSPPSAVDASPPHGLPARAGAALRQFPRQFWLLALGFFVLLCGIDTCFPFETTYLHDRLGFSMTTIGLLLGVPLLVALPLYVLDGVITDRYGRKPAIAAAGCVMAALYATLALSGVMWQIVIAVSAEAAFGWALFLTGSNAMVADLVPLKRRAEAYGITRVTLHVGMVIGPLVGALIIAHDPTYRTNFLTGSAICVSFVVIVVLAFRETRPAAARTGASMSETMRGYSGVLSDRRYLAFCAIAFLPMYGFGQIWSMLPVMLRNAHGMEPRTWGFIVVLYALSVAICQYPMMRWLGHRDHILTMAAASLLIGLGLGGAVLVPWGAATLFCMFVLGQGALLLIPIASTVSAEMAPVALRGRYMGTWTIVQQAGYAFGPLFGGMAMDRLGARGAAGLVIGCGATGAALYAALARRLRGRALAPAGAKAGTARRAEGDEAIGETLAGETPIA